MIGRYRRLCMHIRNAVRPVVASALLLRFRLCAAAALKTTIPEVVLPFAFGVSSRERLDSDDYYKRRDA